jgi:hypothetical protein
MNTTFEKANTAKMALKDMLGRPEWLRGIGIGLDGSEHFIKVNVAEISREILKGIPQKVCGVRVELEAIGEIVAQTPHY